MIAAFLNRIFGVGQVPKRVLPQLEAETIELCAEGITGWFLTDKLRAPGKRFFRRREGFIGCLVLTKQRLIAYSFFKRQINIALNDPGLSNLYVSVIGPDVLSIAFESSLFREGWQGHIEFRFNTDKAQRFYSALVSHGAQRG